VATPFLHANMLPTHSEYLPCIGGRDAASFFESRRDESVSGRVDGVEADAVDAPRRTRLT
jgi:hypothetical protein